MVRTAELNVKASDTHTIDSRRQRRYTRQTRVLNVCECVIETSHQHRTIYCYFGRAKLMHIPSTLWGDQGTRECIIVKYKQNLWVFIRSMQNTTDWSKSFAPLARGVNLIKSFKWSNHENLIWIFLENLPFHRRIAYKFLQAKFFLLLIYDFRSISVSTTHTLETVILHNNRMNMLIAL